MKPRLIFNIIFILLTGFVIWYFDNEIKNHNLNFYSGKDNGYLSRFKSIIVLTTIYYLLNSILNSSTTKNVLKNTLIGFIISISISIVCYIIFLSTDYYGLTFHIVTILISYSLFPLFKKKKTVANT